MAPHPDFLSAPGREQGFNVREHGRLRLISPRQDKYVWEPQELRFRSAIVCPQRGIVSQGFPKFGNLGEYEDDTQILLRALADGAEVTFTEKFDGSLCIRSVIDGEVVLRTRGTIDGGDHGPPMRALAARRYPALLDPSIEPDRSLLFEFVSPAFPIVIRYAEEDLVLIGAVSHADGRLAGHEELVRLAERIGAPLVSTHELPRDPAALVEAVSAWDEREGIVARCGAGQVLVKLKSASYLAAHALRFAFSPRRVAEFCAMREILSEDAFIAAIRESGYDWEIGEEMREPFRAYLAAVLGADARFAELAAMVDEWRSLERREFAARAKPLGREAACLFSLLDGRVDKARAALRADWVERAVKEQASVTAGAEA